jgi:hypothetical protein
MRNCFPFVDSGDSQRVAAGWVNGEPGGGATAGVYSIEPMKPIIRPGSRLCGPRRLLAIHVKLRTIVASKVILDWSPEQISGW